MDDFPSPKKVIRSNTFVVTSNLFISSASVIVVLPDRHRSAVRMPVECDGYYKDRILLLDRLQTVLRYINVRCLWRVTVVNDRYLLYTLTNVILLLLILSSCIAECGFMFDTSIFIIYLFTSII